MKTIANKIMDCIESGDIDEATKMFEEEMEKSRPERIKEMAKGFSALLEVSNKINKTLCN